MLCGRPGRPLSIAADKEDAGAMYDLGFMYENGNGVSKDPAEALRWYQKAADLGNEDAKSGTIRLVLRRGPRTAKSP
jgi:TPR repeat protein